MASQSSRLHHIQSLRAIAAIFVLLFHATNLIKQQLNYVYVHNIFSFGYMGVDLFFVLSGFIITYIHYADFGKKSKLKTFFIKRFTRIVPVYWIVLFFAISVQFLMPSLGYEWKRHISEIAQSMFLIPQEHHPILDVAWTLRHEMLFYLIFGLIFIFNRNLVVLSVFLVFWAGMSTYSFLMNPKDNWFLFTYLFSPHNLEFLLGCIVAFTIVKQNLNLKMAVASLIIGIGIFLLSCFNEYFAFFDVNRVIKWGIPSALLILGSALIDKKSNIRANKILYYIGDASYSIYLTHVPAIYFFILIFSKMKLFNFIGYFSTVTLSVILILACGCMFYQIIERPSLKLWKRLFFKEDPKNRKNGALFEKGQDSSHFA